MARWGRLRGWWLAGVLAVWLPGLAWAADAAPARSGVDFSNGEMYEASFKALFILFILAVLVESGLALLFRWRPIMRNVDVMVAGPALAFLLSLFFVRTFGADVVSGLMRVYTGQHGEATWPGSLLTALIVGGGSGAVNRLFRAFGLRLPVSAEAEVAKPAGNQAWLAVALAPLSPAVGTVNVYMGTRDAVQLVGSIDAGAHGVLGTMGWFLRNRRRMPGSGGHAVEAGHEVGILLLGKDRDNKELKAEWSSGQPIAAGAIIDVTLDPR